MDHLFGGGLVELLGDEDKFLGAGLDVAGLDGGADLANLAAEGRLGGTIAETTVHALTETLLGTK